MKVLVIHDDAAESGGANTFRRDFSKLLESLGNEVFLFTYNADEGADPSRCFIYRFNDRIKFIRHFSRHYFNPSLFLFLRRLIKSVAPDVIHIHQNDTFTNTVLMSCMGSIPVVQTVHDHRVICPTGKGITPDGRLCDKISGTACYSASCLSLSEYARRFFPGLLKKYFMRRAIDAFLVPSEDLQKKMRNYGLKATLLRHYVDTARYSPVRPYPGDERLLFVGRMNQGKGVDVLLKAFKKILAEFPGASLDLIGEDDKEQTFERLAGSLNITERVVFHGLVPHEAIPGFYAKARVVILPASWIENSPLVILEAMASGRPVIAGRIGGIPEIVIDGETGLLCNPGDPDDLFDKLLRLLRDSELARKMGMKGRERVEKRFSLDEHIKGYFEILKKA